MKPWQLFVVVGFVGVFGFVIFGTLMGLPFDLNYVPLYILTWFCSGFSSLLTLKRENQTLLLTLLIGLVVGIISGNLINFILRLFVFLFITHG